MLLKPSAITGLVCKIYHIHMIICLNDLAEWTRCHTYRITHGQLTALSQFFKTEISKCLVFLLQLTWQASEYRLNRWFIIKCQISFNTSKIDNSRSLLRTRFIDSTTFDVLCPKVMPAYAVTHRLESTPSKCFDAETLIALNSSSAWWNSAPVLALAIVQKLPSRIREYCLQKVCL